MVDMLESLGMQLKASEKDGDVIGPFSAKVWSLKTTREMHKSASSVNIDNVVYVAVADALEAQGWKATLNRSTEGYTTKIVTSTTFVKDKQ